MENDHKHHYLHDLLELPLLELAELSKIALLQLIASTARRMQRKRIRLVVFRFIIMVVVRQVTLPDVGSHVGTHHQATTADVPLICH